MGRFVALASLVATLGCGRIGYDAGGSDARGGVGGAAGANGGRGGDGVGGAGGLAGATGGRAGGAAGTGGGAGTAGAAGAAGSTGGGGTSPDGGFACTPMTFGGHGYLFCDDRVDWPTARAACEARGARLVRIDDAAEDAWLATAAGAAPGAQRLEVWIGAYEPTTDNDWRWTDGEAFWFGRGNGQAVGGLYTNWGRTEPNNEIDPEACAVMQLNSTQWYDFQCSTLESFICEVY